MPLPFSDSGRLAAIGIWIVAAVLGVNALKLSWRQLGAAGLPPTLPPPHTSILQGRILGADGGASPGSRQTFALRGDGATLHRTEYFEPNAGNKQVSQRILYFPSAEQVVVDDIREMRTTVKAKADVRASLRDPRSNCANTPLGSPATKSQLFLGEETLGNYRAVRIRNGEVVNWFARDMGCAKIRMRTNSYELSLVSLKAGEPRPELFEIPAHYREVPPSVLFRLKEGSPEAAARDLNYFANRPRR